MARPDKYRRNGGFKDVRVVFIVALEGRLTEYMYFSSLKKIYNSRTLHIDPLKPTNGTSPKQVVALAIQRGGAASATTTLWAVVDHDGRSDKEINEAISLAEESGVEIVFSVPMFEYWLLLHTENPKTSASKEVCYRLMAKMLEVAKYSKGMHEISNLALKAELAVRNSKKIRGSDTEILPEPHGTRVDLLVEKIIDASKSQVC